MVWPARKLVLLHPFHPPPQPAMAGVALRGMKSVPSLSMRCKTTASLRAGTTRAFLGPARLATASAQVLRSEPLTGRVKMTLAAS